MRMYLGSLVVAVVTMTGTARPATWSEDRPVAPANATYTVYYYNVQRPAKVHTYGVYSSYAAAIRAMNFLNSFPEYRAYYRAHHGPSHN